MSRKTKYKKKLSETVADLVKANGGWLNVLNMMTGTFGPALGRIGKPVDCPFPDRHGRGQGRGDFRLSDDPRYEGRAICTCMQASGMSAVELLMEDGIGGGQYTQCMLAIFNALSPETASEHVRKEAAPVARPRTVRLSVEENSKRKEKLSLIARDLVDLDHPSAAPARRYFSLRGIPINRNILDVKFHPGLEYWVDGPNKSKVLVGIFPAIVSAFRTANGRVVNLHRIFINQDGTKANVEKVKKICSPLSGFKGSAINIARTEGRTLHVTEGVEKGWAIHLATGGTVKAAYSCGSLPSLHVDRSKFDHVVIWSDADPVNPNRVDSDGNTRPGDGQFFAWKLARKLFEEGFSVAFMMPDGNPIDVKGRDWEDVIIQEGVLKLTRFQDRLQALKGYAVKGGVYKSHSRVA